MNPMLDNPLGLPLIIAMLATFVVLVFGLLNLFRKDGEEQRSRSNKLMRLRVLTQFIAIVILCGIGLMMGVFKLGG